MKKLSLTAIFAAAALLSAPVMAADNSSDMKPSSPTSSGPGVKGAPGSTAGPSMKPGSSTGSSSGDQGMSPSQDATGVQGPKDSTNGPSDKKPGDKSTSQ